MSGFGTCIPFLVTSLVLMLISYPVSALTLATVVWELAFLAKQVIPLLFKGNFLQKETGGGKGWRNLSPE